MSDGRIFVFFPFAARFFTINLANMYTAVYKRLFIVLLIISCGIPVLGQDSRSWDNQIYLGNKIVFGRNKWNFSGEIQTRMRNNLQSLDNWYLEFVATYMAGKHLEIVPDLRYSIKPTKLELRPGIGVLYKLNIRQIQIVNQVKYQFDIPTSGPSGHALREVVFLNHRFNDRLIGTMVGGFIYRWWPHWNGFQYIRVGPGLTYVFDRKHSLHFSYFVGVENNTESWLWAGIPVIQLSINISQPYEYTPAYYFNF